MKGEKVKSNIERYLTGFKVEGIKWHTLTLQSDDFNSFKKMLSNMMVLQLVFEQEGFALYQFSNGTMLELYLPTTVPAYGYNGAVAFGFRVNDIEAASQGLHKAGFKMLSDIVRVEEMNYAYRHFQGSDGLVYGLNEQK